MFLYIHTHISVVQIIEGFGVAKVIDSDNQNFSIGDYISGMTGWEEYSLITRVEHIKKIEKDDIPLSFHVGLLGEINFFHFISLSLYFYRNPIKLILSKIF